VKSKIKLLFICSRNRQRSLTAEKIFSCLDRYNVRSAGTEINSRIKLTAGHIGWADIIFVMEKKHIRRIRGRFNEYTSGKKIICLNIPDEYQYMDIELVETLKSRVSEYIDI